MPFGPLGDHIRVGNKNGRAAKFCFGGGALLCA